MLYNEIKEVVANCTSTELRKFGLTIGIFLFLIAAWLFWKNKTTAEYFAYTGGALILSGLAVPAILKPVYLGWMSFATVIGFIMTRVILILIFGLVFTPVGLAMRALGKDPLSEKFDRAAKSYWLPRADRQADSKSAERQF